MRATVLLAILGMDFLTRGSDAEVGATLVDLKIAPPHHAEADPGTNPKTPRELQGFLAGTVWEISDRTPDSKVLYTLTFLKNGTFLHSDGRTGAWHATSPRDLKLWKWDPATFNEDLTRFRAVGTGVVYFDN